MKGVSSVIMVIMGHAEAFLLGVYSEQVFGIDKTELDERDLYSFSI